MHQQPSNSNNSLRDEEFLNNNVACINQKTKTKKKHEGEMKE